MAGTDANDCRMHLSRRPGWRVAVLLSAVACLAAGCESPRAGADGRRRPGNLAEVFSGKDIVASHARSLRRIETVWTESVVLVDERERRRIGVGVIIASDSRQSLLLTSRRQIDPRYQRSGAVRTHDVTFRVSSPGTTGAPQYARLSAVFMSDGDMALLLLDAPAGGEAFAVPIAAADVLAQGAGVTLIGSGQGKSFSIADGKVHRRWAGAGASAELVDVKLAKGGGEGTGIIFTHRGAQLAGVAPEGPGTAGAVSAISASRLANPELWEHLRAEGDTRRLLAMIR